ncbi:MAG: IPT/TIG domain-containing protein [Proteiniphilum sp.]|jgi:sugar lactone lactonase YvrE|nr:IPT/TIG domain-containing protein [Proteiniphilum sp.]
MMLTLMVLCVSCEENDSGTTDSPATSPAFDPSKPVVITDFMPKEGAAFQKMIIYGDNFGNDPSIVKVTIGEKEAVVVSVQNNSIYCIVPRHVNAGGKTITVSVKNKGTEKTGSVEGGFDYQMLKMLAGTLTGYRNENDNQGWKDGPFEEAAGFREKGCLAFDPENPHHLYVVYDGGGGGIRLLDLKERVVSFPITTARFPTDRLRSIDFTLDHDYMVISVDRDNDGAGKTQSVFLLKRNDGGTFTEDGGGGPQLVASYMQCNGAAIHPVNGEMYFNSYERGQVFRMDLDDYFNHEGEWNPRLDGGHYEELFTIQDTRWEFKIHIHPSGDYAYINVINQHYILRSDYNKDTKKFVKPYRIAGQIGQNQWVDGVGVSARLMEPYQGVFVKNPEYEAEGKADIYDFYFTDKKSHSIRILTPEGIVKTYAGRGSSGQVSDGNYWGADDGDLREVARFRDPTGIAYDETNNIFYILSTDGRTIRFISEGGVTGEPEEEPEEEPGEESNE